MDFLGIKEEENNQRKLFVPENIIFSLVKKPMYVTVWKLDGRKVVAIEILGKNVIFFFQRVYS